MVDPLSCVAIRNVQKLIDKIDLRLLY